MKKILLLMGLIFTANLAISQNKITGYEYWFDQNYNSKTATKITAVNQYTLSTTLSTSSMSNGLHTFNIRFRDDSTKWSPVSTSFFYKNGDGVDTLRKVSDAEYWFDNLYSKKTNLTVSSGTAGYLLNSDLDVKSLSPGIHTFNIRFKDHTGFWSSVVSQFFYKYENIGYSGSDTMVTAQYWMDGAFNQKTEIGFIPQNQIFHIDSIATTTLSSGIHTFNIRYLDKTGLWSAVSSQFFYKTQVINYPLNQMVETEYWLDENFANKKVIKNTAANQLLFVQDISLNYLAEGLHTFNIRFKDAQGVWSIVNSGYFYKLKHGLITNNLVQSYRYWMDDADTNITEVMLNPPVNQYNLAVDMPMNKVWKGKHLLQMQFKDTLGNWSVVLTDTFAKISKPEAGFNAGNHQFCDSGSVAFTNTSVDYDSVFWDFGDGNYSSEKSPLHNYKKAGKYAVKLLVIDTVVKLADSIRMLDSVWVLNTPIIYLGNDSNTCANSGFSLQATTGPGLIYQWQDNSSLASYHPTKSGLYFCTVSNPLGCHNTDSVNIIIKPLAIANFGFSIDKTVITFSDSAINSKNIFWRFGDGITSVQANPVHTYPAIGNYTAWQIVQNECNSDSTFRVIKINQTKVTLPQNMAAFTAYPNPTDGWVYVKLPTLLGAQNWQIFMANGKEVRDKIMVELTENMLALDMTILPDGLYFVRFTDPNCYSAIPIIKNSR